MGTVAILTSGGDAPGMNTAVAAATKVALAAGHRVVGIRNGYQGLLDAEWVDLDAETVRDGWRRGGTLLGSARCDAFETPEGRARGAETLRALPDLRGLLVIGGDGSLTGAAHLAREHDVPVLGLPASIDNDVGCTSLAIGVDTARNTIVEACDRIADTARSHRRVFLVEVMGRDSGFLAMGAGIAAAADAVLVPERDLGRDVLVEELGRRVVGAFTRERPRAHLLILKAEGVDIPIADLAEHLSTALAEAAPGVGVRATVLGHIVRGGAPSRLDRLIASRLAHAGIQALLGGVRGAMCGWDAREPGGQPTLDPRVTWYPFDEVARHTARLRTGEHPSTCARLRLLDAVAGILAL